MTATCSSVTRRPRVRALNMMGSRYRLSSGLAPLPVNQSTPVMNNTIDQDSISSLGSVRPGRKRRARNAAMARANAVSNASTGHNWLASAPDQSSTRAASTRHRISMDRVLRTSLLDSSRGCDGSRARIGRHLQLLDGAPDLEVTLQQGRPRRDGNRRGFRVALQLDVGNDAAVIDGRTGGRVIERGGELDGPVLRQRHDGLHRALAESGSSHEFRAMLILQRAGDDLRRGG